MNSSNNYLNGKDQKNQKEKEEIVDYEMAPTDAEKKEVGDDGIADFETAIAATGYGKFNILLLLAVLPCMSANAFDTSTMSYIIPFAECDLELTPFNKGTLNAITYGGMICSAFLWGFLSDTLGRRSIFVIGYFVHGSIGIISSFSQSFIVMLILRFFSGFVGNGPHIVVMSYVSEVHGGKYRARALMIMGMCLSIISVCLPGIAWGIIPQAWSYDLFGGYIKYSSWNLFVAVCGIPSILAGTLMWFFDESPKFLMSQGRNEEALIIFRKIYSYNTGLPPETYPVKQLIEEKKQVSIDDPKRSIAKVIKIGWQQVVPLFKSPHALHALHVFLIQAFCFFGLNTIRLWVPQFYSIMEDYNLMQEKGDITYEASSLCDVLMFSSRVVNNATVDGYNETNFILEPDIECSVNLDKSVMYSNSMITGGVNMVFLVSATYLVNMIGKRNMMVGGYTIALVCGLLLQWAMNFPFLVSTVSIFMSLAAVCTTCLTSVVVEMFPTTLRAMAVSLLMMFGRLAALSGNLIFPILLEWNCIVPFYMVAAAMLFAGILAFFIPDTRNKLT